MTAVPAKNLTSLMLSGVGFILLVLLLSGCFSKARSRTQTLALPPLTAAEPCFAGMMPDPENSKRQ